MTPEYIVSVLVRQLAAHGETVTLQRLSKGSIPQAVEAEVECRAFVRSLQGGNQKEALINSVAQTDLWLIMAPIEIEAAGWESGAQAGADQRVPMKGNKVRVAGRLRNIEAVHPFYVNDVLVRIEMQVRG